MITSTARNLLDPQTPLPVMTEGQQAIEVALTATCSGALLNMAQVPFATVLGKAARIDGRTAARLLECDANDWPVVRGGMPVEGSLQFADLRRCTGEAVGGRLHATQPASDPTAMRRPPQVARRREISAFASRPDPGSRQLEERSATLRWETGARMDGCRRRCRQSMGPMPRQTSCGDSLTPPATAPAQNPVWHIVPHERGRVDAPPCDEVANCR